MGNYKNIKKRQTTMKLFILIASLVLISQSQSLRMLGAVPADISDCPDSTNQMITNFQANWDNTPAKGATIGASLDSTALVDVTIKSIRVQTFYQGTTAQVDNFDYGKSAAAGENLHWYYQQYLPSFTPSGAYTLQVDYLDNDGVSQGCAIVNLSV